MNRRLHARRIGAALLAAALATPAAAQVAPNGNEDEFYRLVTIPIPEGVVLEVGGMEPLPDGRLAVSTRRGEVWMVENPYLEGSARPHFRRFAQGLHESLGLAYRDGSFYTAQRGELTRLRDRNGDGRADLYETVYSWPLSGNYHEYSFGPIFTPTGDMLVTLNLAWIGRGASLVPWRGWALQVDSAGRMTPLATGMRSPAGFGYNLDGELFYSENQGDWVGSGSITHVEKGDFVGNPEGLRWSGLPGSPLTLAFDDVPNTGEPKHVVAQRVPALKTPAVWFPHALMGISTSAVLVDSTQGRFGPFHGQMFVGDQGHSRIMRVFLERVDGVYQGAVFPFRSGFASGILRQAWGRDGSLFVGMTSRGWSATGKEPYSLQRLVWTGKMPFEAERIEARPDGWEITFTAPVDRATAGDPASYTVNGFTYRYHLTYGSPPIEQAAHPVRAVVVSPDGLRARLVVDGARPGFVHEIRMAGVRSAAGGPLLHDVAYYTLNRIPTGARVSVAPTAPTAARSAGSAAAPWAEGTARRQTAPPASWGGQVDANLVIGTQPGLRFDRELVTVQPGARVRLTFNNTDDMLHNWVLTRPGRADAVAQAAMEMGLQGAARDYVPAEGVLHNTALLQPDRSESVYFVAPTEPGDYPFLCSFPGHGLVMRGVLRVGR